MELKRKTKAVTWKSPIKRNEWMRAKRWRENRAEWTTTIFSLRNSISRLFSADSQQYLISYCWTALYPDYMTVGSAAIYKVFIAFGSEIISLVSTWIVVCFQGNCRPSSARTGMVLPRLVFWAHHVLTQDVAKTKKKNNWWERKLELPFPFPAQRQAVCWCWWLIFKGWVNCLIWLVRGLQSIWNIGSWSLVWMHVKH